jgi:DNA helicase-2/ATP-dependent DNA helicase PcrA
MREATQGLTLRQIIETRAARFRPAGLLPSEKEGQDRIENLDELVNAAEAFVTQEGFGKDAVALPVTSRARVAAAWPAGARRRHRRDHVARWRRS